MNIHTYIRAYSNAFINNVGAFHNVLLCDLFCVALVHSCTFESYYIAVDNVILEQLEMLCCCLQLTVDNNIVILCCANRMRNILVGKRN